MSGPADQWKVVITIAKHVLVVLILLLFLYTSYCMSAYVSKTDLQGVPALKNVGVYRNMTKGLPDPS